MNSYSLWIRADFFGLKAVSSGLFCWLTCGFEYLRFGTLWFGFKIGRITTPNRSRKFLHSSSISGHKIEISAGKIIANGIRAKRCVSVSIFGHVSWKSLRPNISFLQRRHVVLHRLIPWPRAAWKLPNTREHILHASFTWLYIFTWDHRWRRIDHRDLFCLFPNEQVENGHFKSGFIFGAIQLLNVCEYVAVWN